MDVVFIEHKIFLLKYMVSRGWPYTITLNGNSIIELLMIIIHEQNTKKIIAVKESLYVIKIHINLHKTFASNFLRL